MTIPKAVLVFTLLSGCAGTPRAEHDDPTPRPEVVVGVPAGDDGLDFAPLTDGEQIQLETFFQGGTHMTLAIRCIALGSSAFVSVRVENQTTLADVEVQTPSTNPRPLLCRDEYTCDLVPFIVTTSGLVEPGDEINGLRVTIEASVENAAGDQGNGSAEVELRTDELDALEE